MISARVMAIKAEPGGDTILTVLFEDVFERSLAFVSMSLTAGGEMAIATIHPGEDATKVRFSAPDGEARGAMYFLHMPPPPEGGPVTFPPEWLPPSPEESG